MPLLQIILIKLVGKKISPCFVQIDLKENTPNKFLNTSAKKIKNKEKLSLLSVNILYNFDNIDIDNNNIT